MQRRKQFKGSFSDHYLYDQMILANVGEMLRDAKLQQQQVNTIQKANEQAALEADPADEL